MAYKTIQLFDKEGNKCFSNKGPAGRILVDHGGYIISWFKVATITCTESFQDIYCRIKIVIPFKQNCSGILIARIRVNGEKKIESCDTYWESKTTGYFSPRNVAISFDSSNNYIDLYFQPISQYCTIYYEVEDCLCRNGANSNQNYTNISINSYDNVNGITSLPNNVIYSVYLHRIGDIYMSTSSINPQDLFGGVWEQIKDRFLLACGSTYSNGSTGGEASVILQNNNIPSDFIISTDKGVNKAWCTGHWDDYSNYAYPTINVGGTSFGANQPHNNMPPYLAVYIWKRIA